MKIKIQCKPREKYSKYINGVKSECQLYFHLYKFGINCIESQELKWDSINNLILNAQFM